MKYLLVILLIPFFCYAQVDHTNTLVFNKKFTECEDKWVAIFDTSESNVYSYGFVYLDEQAGYTFHREGSLRITDEGKFEVDSKIDNIMFKIRLSETNMALAIIPDEKVEELGHPLIPEWLSIYKGDDPIHTMIRRGSQLNHNGESERALPILEKAYMLKPDAEDVEFELSYAYNALKKFDKAIPVLEKAVERAPDDFLLLKELSYAYTHLQEFDKAEEVSMKALECDVDNDKYKSEICVNLIQYFFYNKDKEKFNKWAELTKKYAEEDSPIYKFVIQLEENFGK